MNKVLIIILVAAAVLAGSFFFRMDEPATAPTEPSTPSVDNPPESSESTENTEDNPTMVHEVMIENFVYSPATITIKVGDAITWNNQDSAPHSATADDKSFDTGVLNQGQTGTITFDKAGTYTYYCSVHPDMKATVVVTE